MSVFCEYCGYKGRIFTRKDQVTADHKCPNCHGKGLHPRKETV